MPSLKVANSGFLQPPADAHVYGAAWAAHELKLEAAVEAVASRYAGIDVAVSRTRLRAEAQGVGSFVCSGHWKWGVLYWYTAADDV